MKVPDDVFAQICADMEAAEMSGELDRIFKGGPRAPDQKTNRNEFLHSFSPGMQLWKSTFLKIYGYEITAPGFAENALSRLEILGCSKARAYYSGVVAEYEYQHEKELKVVASWYRKQCENNPRKEAWESRTEKEAEQQQELLELLETKRQILKELLQIQSGKSTG